jgi:hypothetical protein
MRLMFAVLVPTTSKHALAEFGKVSANEDHRAMAAVTLRGQAG